MCWCMLSRRLIEGCCELENRLAALDDLAPRATVKAAGAS
jgi:hypothetical protein